MLNSNQAAKRVGITKSTIFCLLKKGIFPKPDRIDASRGGRVYYWKESTIKAEIQRRELKSSRIESINKNKRSIKKRIQNGEFITKIAKEYGVSRTTITTLIKKEKIKPVKQKTPEEYIPPAGWTIVNETLNRITRNQCRN